MMFRHGMVFAGLVIVLALLGQVDLDTAYLEAREVPTAWWWSAAMPLLLGSALPPLLGIALVLWTRRLLLSLGVATFVAALLAAGPGPVVVAETFAVDYLWGSLADLFHLAIIIFTTSLIGLVSVANTSGGTQGIVRVILRFAKGIRGARVATALMGFAVFFDDYANTALVGPTMRPLFDKLCLSREKLAYIIDSTAAPVAGLALISTWVGTEVSYMQDAAQAVGVQTSGYALFFSALGYRFYCVFALCLVFVTAVLGRDFGPMLRAERRALTTGQVSRPGSQPLTDVAVSLAEVSTPRWYNAVVPIGVVLGLIVASVYHQGAPAGSGFLGVFSLGIWREAFVSASNLADGNFLSYLFAAAAIVGSVLAIVLPAAQGVFSLQTGVQAWFEGARSMLPALGILVLAWALSEGCKELHTASYVGAAIRNVAGTWVPLVVFFVAGLVAFATGTSWGTMAILIPTAAQVAFQAGGEALMLVTMAAVLDGAIFGDHCSPISDTTVLSSICAGCDHLDHVRTQIPYALLGCTVAGTFGYALVAALGAPLWLGYVLGLGVLVSVVRGFGKPAAPEPRCAPSPDAQTASA